ncbi:hypothetical protein OM076_29520 [Solirubrobacter ginsenosidimutans]|uniref:Universal stress protein n=1 Tax=Solirubrobacter ginsenosidimutans TaxID=490573 RepID=A0A9X3S5S5_9ACTN|nr:hypothetical protein [Solirubrobacter ginsenosidimutans]MDA0164446.1 hypothetical protein [Solirubrobacter ginsenosidimutans]
MAAAPTHRTLIVANRTAGTHLLLEEVERRAAARPTAFVLLIPAVTSTKAADWTLNEALKSLRRAAQGPTGHRPTDVEGIVGGADPFESIEKALADGNFDDVVISPLPKRTSQWLKRDLPARVEKLNVPVTVITPPKEKRMTIEESGLYGTGLG